jgi:hypothetical protein
MCAWCISRAGVAESRACLACLQLPFTPRPLLLLLLLLLLQAGQRRGDFEAAEDCASQVSAFLTAAAAVTELVLSRLHST